ncbi:MAG: hypothetical protein KFF73_01605, partial [Cyclobacteriaceae bacterium]|nr:hypothetical protein [Cyclobacteriaceae bacterium]
MTPRSDGTPVSAVEAMFYKRPLIIGPIEYDEEIFNEKVIRLGSWLAQELADKISSILGNGIKSIDYSLTAVDLTTNMKIIKEVYESLKR